MAVLGASLISVGKVQIIMGLYKIVNCNVIRNVESARCLIFKYP